MTFGPHSNGREVNDQNTRSGMKAFSTSCKTTQAYVSLVRLMPSQRNDQSRDMTTSPVFVKNFLGISTARTIQGTHDYQSSSEVNAQS